MPLVSVIVPVFNVEAHLNGCINSILKQSYTDIEIILINDGSSDSSGEICDIFSANFKNVKTIHQENYGVSVARNAGIEIARGEFLCFVDSDDQIHSRMIESLLEPIFESSDISISVCGLQPYFDDFDAITLDNPRSFSVFPRDKAVKELLYQRIINGPVAKLYHRSLVESVRFPANVKIGEDLLFNIEVFQRASQVSVKPEKLYGYYMRDGSAMHSSLLVDRVYLIKRLKEKREGCLNSEVVKAFSARVFSESLYSLFLLKNLHGSSAVEERRQVHESIRQNRLPVLLDSEVNKFFRLLAMTSFISFELPRIVFELRRTLGRVVKILKKRLSN